MPPYKRVDKEQKTRVPYYGRDYYTIFIYCLSKVYGRVTCIQIVTPL